MRRDHARRGALVVLTTLCASALVGLLAPTATAQACTASLTITPNTATGGQQVVLQGTGHTASSNISLAQDGVTVLPQAATTDASGAFTFNGVAHTTAGSHSVVATDAGGRCSQATYTVTSTTVTTVVTNIGTTTSTADLVTTASPTTSFVAGQPGNLTVRVTNLGPGPTSVGSIVVTLSLPPGITPFSATGGDFACTSDGRSLFCTRTASLPAGQSVDLFFVFAVAPYASPTSTMVVNATDPRVFDPNNANNTVNVAIQTLQTIGGPGGFYGTGVAPSWSFPAPATADSQQQQQQQQQTIVASPAAAAAAPAAAVPSARLPFTGSRVRSQVVVGALTLASGLLFVAIAGRRRRAAARL